MAISWRVFACSIGIGSVVLVMAATSDSIELVKSSAFAMGGDGVAAATVHTINSLAPVSIGLARILRVMSPDWVIPRPKSRRPLRISRPSVQRTAGRCTFLTRGPRPTDDNLCKRAEP